MSVGSNLQEMENVVTKGAAAAEPMPKLDLDTPGQPSIEDLGGPSPENYRPDDDSAKLKEPGASLAQVKDVVNRGAKAADPMPKGMKEEETEVEGEMVSEMDLKKLKNPGAALGRAIDRVFVPPVADGTLKGKPNTKKVTEERKPEVEAQGKKVAGYEKEGKYQGITSKFRKENPGSRQKPKARGSKPTEGELTQSRIQKHNQRVAKHGFTSKEKKESKAREKYDSARD